MRLLPLVFCLTYYQAIARACGRAGISVWAPNRLRHNTATLLRQQFGIEAARAILGYKSSPATEVYAEMDHAKAADIMGQVGKVFFACPLSNWPLGGRY